MDLGVVDAGDGVADRECDGAEAAVGEEEVEGELACAVEIYVSETYWWDRGDEFGEAVDGETEH